MSKRALILGIGGQDGSYLADILLERGYVVGGFHRHSSYDNLARIAHVRNPDRVQLFRGDLLDEGSVLDALMKFKPNEVYNVADQDNVGWSRAAPTYQRMVTAAAVFSLLTAVREAVPDARVFQPLSCTMFGNAPPPQNESTGLGPQSPYAVQKARAWSHCWYFRNTWRMHVSCGIMFNHDSPRRAPGYLLQDVCRQAVEVAAGRLERVTVRNINAEVDVGYARDYMEAAVDMLQLPEPGDYCIGTGESWTVGRMAAAALEAAGVPYEDIKRPDGKGGFFVHHEPDPGTGPQPSYRADITKARAAWGFAPKTTVGQLIEMLVDHFRGHA